MLRSKVIPTLYILSIILITLPPLQVVSGLPSQHGLSKAIWIFISSLYGYSIIKSKERIQKQHIAFIWMYLIFLLSQAISIVSAFNIYAYMETMEELVIMGMFIISTLWISQMKNAGKTFLTVIMIITSVDLFQYVILYIFPDIVNSGISRYFNQEYLSIINFNLGRERIYFESYAEAYLPLLLFIGINKTGLIQKASFINSATLIVFSYITNFRSKFITLIFSLLSSTAILSKKLKTLLFVLIPSFIFIFVISDNTVLERFNIFSDWENVRTIESRLVNWEMALDMGIQNPVFGVGAGNYFDYVDSSLKSSITIFKDIEREFNYGITDPHNIIAKTFAETGLIGTLGLFALLVYFIFKDVSIMKSKNTFPKLLVVGFWTIFIYSLANPGFTSKYLMNYWFLRLMIQTEINI